MKLKDRNLHGILRVLIFIKKENFIILPSSKKYFMEKRICYTEDYRKVKPYTWFTHKISATYKSI